MHKRAPKFEWQSSDNLEDPHYAPWPPAVDTTSSVPVVPQRWRTIDGGVAALLLLLAMAGGWLWHTAQVGQDQTAREARAAKQTEQTSVDSVSFPTATTGSSGIPAPAWEYQLQREYQTLRAVLPTGILEVAKETTVNTSNLQGGPAVIEFIATAKEGSQVYRQTRFYRYSGAGSLRTRPVAELWGAPHHLESSHFIFLFRQNDAQVVAKVAPQIDTLYGELQRHFGLTPIDEKLVVEVTVEHVTGAIVTLDWANQPLVVPSPAIYLAPVELSDAAILAQSIALPLVGYMGKRVIKDYSIPARWQGLQLSLQLQQLWDLQLPLAAWRHDVVQWLYPDRSTPSTLPPERFAQFCTIHNLWMLSPVAIGISLGCRSSDDGSSFMTLWQSSAYTPHTHLKQLRIPITKEYLTADPEINLYYSSEVVAEATLIEYAVAAYGYKQLPVLLANLSQYDSWNTLIPAVYGVSAAEFEKGWRAYLVQEYGATIDKPKFR